MACHAVRDDKNRVIAIITCANVYRYKGFTFEMHRYCGPLKLKKDGDPASKMGRKFWKTVTEWEKLTAKQKSKTLISE